MPPFSLLFTKFKIPCLFHFPPHYVVLRPLSVDISLKRGLSESEQMWFYSMYDKFSWMGVVWFYDIGLSFHYLKKKQTYHQILDKMELKAT